MTSQPPAAAGAAMGAEEAYARAQAIAAQLGGGSTSSSTTTSKTTGSKRKRWGLTADDATTTTTTTAAVGSQTVPATRTATHSTAEALAAAIKRAKQAVAEGLSNQQHNGADAAQQQQQQQPEVTKRRVWITVTEERSPAHFVSYLSPRLTTTLEQVPAYKEASIKAELKGRGSSTKPTTLYGMPEEPLHILLEGTLKWALEEAEVALDQLLAEAEKAPPEAPPEPIPESHLKPDSASNGGTLALVATGSSGGLAAASHGGGYKPASVAHLIGQVNAAQKKHGGDLLASGGAAGEGTWIEEEMRVPHGVVGYVIGRGGETISSLQQRTGCKVQVQRDQPQSDGSSSSQQQGRIIQLSATSQEALDECRQLIEAMVRERTQSIQGSSGGGGGGGGMGGGGGHGGSGSGGGGGKDSLVQEAIAAGHVHLTLEVPDSQVGLVIGKSGATIRSIQEATGASVQVPQQPNGASSGSGGEQQLRTISITHPTQQGAEYAKQMIQDLVKNKPATVGGQQQPAQPVQPQITVQVPIPDSDVGLCIGRQGCVIRQMQTISHTRIQIPSSAQPGETHRMATVTGTQEGCDQVRHMIQRIITEQSSASIMAGSPFQQQQGAGGPHGGGGGGGVYQGGGGYGQQQPYGGGQQQQHGYYGGVGYQQADQQPQPQQQQQQYSAEWAAYHAAQQAAAAQATTDQQPSTAAAAATATATTTDTTYHEQFFRYAYYYGEEAARAYYGAWAPPVGTPNPYGVNPNGIQPAPAAGVATATTETAAPSSAAVAAAQPAASYPAAAAAPQSAPAQHHPVEAKETSRRKVSNLPAWMTKK